ncbi:hypothetical protein PYW07_013459 [Mythimna separata]|uniref:Uncharacterized protein n=1 Tax=Mythimna separata TaxID=271217 RepID=A0AAD7Y6T8_MYTSE|nr:hypothetical protein PYW07_013459 [Mythimna separata]
MKMCDELCRLCLSKENLTALFTNIVEKDNFSQVLYLTTGLKIQHNDGFPQNICEKCTVDVHTASNLRNRSQQSEQKLTELGYQRNIEKTNDFTENINKTDELTTQLVEKLNTSNENYEDLINSDGFPELQVEIEFDRLDHNGGETKWPPDGTVKKLSRKEKRQQYLELVEGEFDPAGPVKCKICKKSVSNWKCFISHAKLHLGFNFVCEFCGKRFISITQLKRHCRSYHGMRRELACQHCSYLALDTAQLKLHERRVHTLERPFVCECGASYHSRRCLLQHLESHRTVAAVQCLQCPLAFKSARQLARHRYRAHRQTTPRAVPSSADPEGDQPS